MAMSLKSLDRLLTEAFGADLQREIDAERDLILTGFATENYESSDGSKSLGLVIQRNAKGRYIEIQALGVYDLDGCEHVAAVCRTLLGICLRTAVVQYAIDESDGEVRATVEIILADGVLTAEQLRENIEHLVGAIETCHRHVVRAMETGEITFPNESRPRSILPVASASAPPQASMNADVEGVLREMWKATMAEGVEQWKQAPTAAHDMRHW
jgi:hypothetical protein